MAAKHDDPTTPEASLKGEKERLPKYFTFNPGVFDDKIWSTKDLQKLARKLGVQSHGSRRAIVQRLREWHRSNPEDPYRLASNFSMLGVQVYSPPTQENQCKPLSNRKPKVDARLLSPLISKAPPKPILKGKTPTRRGLTPSKKAVFSPYNRVQIIPSREEQKISPWSKRFKVSQQHSISFCGRFRFLICRDTHTTSIVFPQTHQGYDGCYDDDEDQENY